MAIQPEITQSEPFCPSRLAAARLRRGMTIEKLAKTMGVERHAISRYEAGLFTPSVRHLKAMAHALHFPERFFRGDDIGELTPKKASLR